MCRTAAALNENRALGAYIDIQVYFGVCLRGVAAERKQGSSGKDCCSFFHNLASFASWLSIHHHHIHSRLSVGAPVYDADFVDCLRHVKRKRCMEGDCLACSGMLKREGFGVKSLAGKKVKKVSDEAFAFGEIKVSD